MNDIPLELKKEFNLEDSEDEKKIDFEKIKMTVVTTEAVKAVENHRKA